MVYLETDRLTIRNFKPEDWRDLQELAIAYRNSEAAKYEDPWPTSDEEVKGMASWFAGGDDFLATCIKASGKLIGLIHVGHRDEDEGHIHNLGYVFHPGHHGKGYATEGCWAAMAYVFETLTADGILTGTHPDNRASIRLLERLGLRAVARGEYAISAHEWQALQAAEG